MITVIFSSFITNTIMTLAFFYTIHHKNDHYLYKNDILMYFLAVLTVKITICHFYSVF